MGRRFQTGIMVAACLLCMRVLYGAETPSGTYQIELTVGDVQVSLDNGKTWSAAETDGELPGTAVVRTAAGAMCDISLPGEKGSFRVMEISEIQLSGIGTSMRFNVRKGWTLFDIFKPLLGDETLEVETETAVASVRGTEFSVEAEGDTGTVSVADGTVLVRRNVAADVDGDLAPDFNDAVQMTVTKEREISFSRGDNEQFLAAVRKFRANKAELRKFLREERKTALRRIRAMKNRDRILNNLRRKKADYQKFRQRRAKMLKNRLQIQKKKATLKNIRKKMKMKRAMMIRKRILWALRNRR